MKKILTALLSLALLLGSVPVYGAEDAILSQSNTENITEQSELSETAENSGEAEQEPETPGGESEIPGEEPEGPDEEPEVPAARKRAQLSRRNRDRRNDLGRKMVNADRLLRILREEQQPVRRPDAAGPGEFVGQRPGNFAGEQQRLPGVFR